MVAASSSNRPDDSFILYFRFLFSFLFFSFVLSLLLLRFVVFRCVVLCWVGLGWVGFCCVVFRCTHAHTPDADVGALPQRVVPDFLLRFVAPLSRVTALLGLTPFK